MRQLIAVSASLIFAIFPTSAIGQEATMSERVDALVERLVSKNPAPREVKGSAAEYPEGYDKDLQKPISAAYRELNSLREKAFPHLIKHFDDKRYALTADGGPMDKNFTVGELCYYIVELQIQPDKGWTVGDGDPRIRKFRPHYPRYLNLQDKTEAAKWWELNKDKSLVEIQIAVTEWTIAEEEKNPTEYTDEERSALKMRLQDLRKAGKPLPSTMPWFK